MFDTQIVPTPATSYFQTVGQQIADHVDALPDLGPAFARLAADVVSRIDCPSVDPLVMADWILDTPTLPKQVNLKSGFGQPPLVVYHHEKFYIEVLFWFPSRTSIHGHGFTGAFRVLHGYSVQVEYRFVDAPGEDPTAELRHGTLEPRRVDFIAPGKVCPILGQDDFVHTVVHMGQPSLTLVARTNGDDDFRQYTFHPPGLAERYRQRDPLRHTAQVLAVLQRTHPDQFTGRLTRFLAGSDEVTALRVLRHLQDEFGLAEFEKQVRPAMEQACGDRFPAVVAAIREKTRSNGLWAMIQSSKDPRMQFRLALAELFPQETQLLGLIRASHPGSDPAALLKEWETAAGQPGMGLVPAAVAQAGAD